MLCIFVAEITWFISLREKQTLIIMTPEKETLDAPSPKVSVYIAICARYK